jgi:hypothetical protein
MQTAEFEVGKPFGLPLPSTADLSVAMEAQGRRIVTVVVAASPLPEDATSIGEDIYGYAWTDLGILGGALCLVVGQDEWTWKIHAPLMGDASQFDPLAPDAHVLVLVDARDGMVKQVSRSPMPPALGARIRERARCSESEERARALARFAALSARADVWEDGARWVMVDGAWEAACELSRALS